MLSRISYNQIILQLNKEKTKKGRNKGNRIIGTKEKKKIGREETHRHGWHVSTRCGPARGLPEGRACIPARPPDIPPGTAAQVVYHPRLRLFLPRCLPRRCRRRRRRRRYSRGSPFQPRGRSRPRFYLAPCAATDREREQQRNNISPRYRSGTKEREGGERKNRERKKKRERRVKTLAAGNTPMILFK